MAPRKAPITGIQIWTAVFSTASAIMIGIILNTMNELREWKGEMNEWRKGVENRVEQTNTSLSNLTVLVSQNQGRQSRNEWRIENIEAVLPKKLQLKLQTDNDKEK